MRRHRLLYAALVALGLVCGALGWTTCRYRSQRDYCREQLACVPADAWARADIERPFHDRSPDEQAVIREHLDRALSGLGGNPTEREIAAAVNDYVYQYLVCRDNSGSAAKMLSEGYAICGGAAVCMQEMLCAKDIRAKHGFLLGIPAQGSHCLVEVIFKNGTRGLFDPTFGVFWHDPVADKPVGMAELLEHPELADRTLWKSVHSKRKKDGDPVLPMATIEPVYRHSPGHHEWNYDPAACFREAAAGGLAGEGMKTVVEFPLRPGKVLGSKQWVKKEEEPWMPLARQKDDHGKYLSFAHVNGQRAPGYDVMHVYCLSELTPGAKYTLTLHISAVSRESVVAIHPVLGGERTSYTRLQPKAYQPDHFEPVQVSKTLTAPRETMTVLGMVNGSVILHAIELTAGKAQSAAPGPSPSNGKPSSP